MLDAQRFPAQTGPGRWSRDRDSDRTADRIGADDTFPQVCPWLSGQSRCLRKGYGFLGYFGLSVFFFPFGLIAAAWFMTAIGPRWGDGRGRVSAGRAAAALSCGPVLDGCLP